MQCHGRRSGRYRPALCRPVCFLHQSLGGWRSERLAQFPVQGNQAAAEGCEEQAAEGPEAGQLDGLVLQRRKQGGTTIGQAPRTVGGDQRGGFFDGGDAVRTEQRFGVIREVQVVLDCREQHDGIGQREGPGIEPEQDGNAAHDLHNGQER